VRTFRAAGVAVHCDGARLWEACAGLGCTPRALASLFDSCYVSFYKGVGSPLPGAILAGSRADCDAARLWLRRLGGNLFSMHPMLVSAAMRVLPPPRGGKASAGDDADVDDVDDVDDDGDGDDDDQADANDDDDVIERLGLAAHLSRARSLARALGAVAGIEIVPREPHVNMFHVHVTAPGATVAACRAAAAQVADELGLEPVPPARFRLVETRGGGTRVSAELYIGSASQGVDVREAAAAWAGLVARLQA
jgi:threonine aldolase